MDSEILEQANDLARMKQYEKALKLFRQIDSAEGLYGEAACLYRIGQSDEARAAIEKCLDSDPLHSKAIDLLAKISPAKGTSKPDRIPKDQIMVGINTIGWLYLVAGIAVVVWIQRILYTFYAFCFYKGWFSSFFGNLWPYFNRREILFDALLQNPILAIIFLLLSVAIVRSVIVLWKDAYGLLLRRVGGIDAICQSLRSLAIVQGLFVLWMITLACGCYNGLSILDHFDWIWTRQRLFDSPINLFFTINIFANSIGVAFKLLLIKWLERPDVNLHYEREGEMYQMPFSQSSVFLGVFSILSGCIIAYKGFSFGFSRMSVTTRSLGIGLFVLGLPIIVLGIQSLEERYKPIRILSKILIASGAYLIFLVMHDFIRDGSFKAVYTMPLGNNLYNLFFGLILMGAGIVAKDISEEVI